MVLTDLFETPSPTLLGAGVTESIGGASGQRNRATNPQMQRPRMKGRPTLFSIVAAIMVFAFSQRVLAQSQIDAELKKVSWNSYQDEAVKLLQEYLR